MKTMRKSVLLMLMLLGFTATQLSAQIVVHVRPPRPHVNVTVRPARPSPRHVWVREDWEPNGNEYRWHGGYWAEPPRPRARWVEGHWRHSRAGYIWIPGHWR
ncbi:MAG: YXWGXW repeat-containing protein [Bacteroidetes bacterium]|nr:YXWGXW repeat-containing protein [Bacteroidota bacterium]